MLAEITISPNRTTAFAIKNAFVIGNAYPIDLTPMNVRRQLRAIAVKMMDCSFLEIRLSA